MKSAKCVTNTDRTLSEDGSYTLTRYGTAVQGNATSPRGQMKSHHNSVSNRNVGGTLNPIRAMLLPAHAKLCKVITHEADVHEWRNGVMVRIMPEVSVTYTEQSQNIPTLAFIHKRAQKLDISDDEYCAMIGVDIDAVLAKAISES